MFHSWNSGSRDNHMSSAYWTRANAWVVLAAPWIACEVAGMADIPGNLIHRYKQLAKAMHGYQGENGLWPTVVNHPHFYAETFGSAGIAAGGSPGTKSTGWTNPMWKPRKRR
ncbi:glycoside hydrolase family 88 protein [Cohnella zeiphila]|uniref:glycoside hydrolase family 88 protein n=1 Tax=Cohnella zeiphila TaxID=2761120 RepID=UPI00235457AA|nr:glycoside hydrolase family 88 protein [Cohnella zeiphila]